MGSKGVVLPDVKFTGQEDIREFLRDFEIFVLLNEWLDEKAGKYLAMYLKDEAKSFYHQQEEDVRKSYKRLSKALTDRYEGGLALLKYKKEFNGRVRKDGEALHSYLSALCLAYNRAYRPPPVDPLPTEATAEKESLAESILLADCILYESGNKLFNNRERVSCGYARFESVSSVFIRARV